MKVEYKPILIANIILFFVIGDLVTTIYGLEYTNNISEKNALIASIINDYHILILVPIKLGFTAIFYGVYRVIPNPHNMGVLLGLNAVGIAATMNNILVLLKI